MLLKSHNLVYAVLQEAKVEAPPPGILVTVLLSSDKDTETEKMW